MNKRLFALLTLGPVLGIIFLAAVAACILVFTSYPFQSFAAALRDEGYQVEGLTGSLNTGLSIKRLAKADGDGQFEMNDVRIAYSGLWQLYKHRRLIIENIEVGKLRLNITQMPRLAGGASQAAEKKTGPGAAGQAAAASSASIKEFGIQRVDIRDVELTLPLLPYQVKLDSVRLAGFSAWPEENRMELGEFAFESNFANLVVRSLAVNGDRVTMDESMRGILKKPVHPLIKEEIPFSLRLTAQGRKLEEAIMTAINDQVRFEVSPKQIVTFRTRGLTLSEHLSTSWPIEDLDIDLSADNYMSAIANSKVKARFKFQGRTFTLARSAEDLKPAASRAVAEAALPGPVVPFAFLGRRELKAFHVREGRVFELTFSPNDVGNTFGGASKPWARLRSDASENPQSVLSDLIYGAPFEQLSPDKQQAVVASLKNFSVPDVTSPEELRDRLQNVQIALVTETDPLKRYALNLEARKLMEAALGNPSATLSTKSPLACVNPSKAPIKGTFTALDGLGSIHEYDAHKNKTRSWVVRPSLALKTPGAWPAVDGRTGRVFVALSDRVLDLANGKTLMPSAGLPKLSGTAGAAFDSRRNRLIVLGGRGSSSIYAFDVATGKWSLAANLPSGGFSGLAYDGARDRFYSLRYSPGGQTLDRIAIFNSNLSLEREVELKQPTVYSPGTQSWSLSAESGLFVIDVSPFNMNARMPAVASASRQTFVIDTGCGEMNPLK